MYAFKIVCLVVVLRIIDDVNGDCMLSLKNDFGTPPPVYIRNGAYLSPEPTTGAISFRRSETLQIACPGNKNYVVLGNDKRANVAKNDVLEAHCIINSTFRVERWIGQFGNVSCKNQPWYTAEETKEVCHGGSTVYRVGYKVKNVFHTLYEACFNKYQLTTHYVKHILSPASDLIQQGVSRPSFIEGDLFGKVRMSKLYKVDNQRDRIDAILGANMSHEFVTKKQFLTRGHLAARADYTLGAEMRATFHYVNTAPQWRRGNAGDWAALEEALRRRVRSRGAPVSVYTGVHGVMALADERGRQRPVYLGVDENNNGLVPVPVYFYKVVHDRHTKKAVAFVSINSSFYNSTMLKELTFCSDICAGNAKYSWIKWRANDGTHSFCCEYAEFAEEIDYLPELDVTGAFH